MYMRFGKLICLFLLCQFAPGYQPTVGVDYGFKIETVGGQEGEY